jgi:hypothetical protein
MIHRALVVRVLQMMKRHRHNKKLMESKDRKEKMLLQPKKKELEESKNMMV